MIESTNSTQANVAGKTAAEIAALGHWFHNLHLPDGTQTAPNHSLGDFPAYKWKHLAQHIPADLSGWTALDIGCNAGFYTFELAKRGATVTGIDSNLHYLNQAQWAAHQYKLEDRVTFRQMQVYDLAYVRRDIRSCALYGCLLSPALSNAGARHRGAEGKAHDGVSDAHDAGQGGLYEIPTVSTSRAESRCSNPAGPRWPLSSTALPATRPTGGRLTTPASKPCCGPAGSGWPRRCRTNSILPSRIRSTHPRSRPGIAKRFSAATGANGHRKHQ